MMLKEEVKQLIAKGELDVAIQQLIEHFKVHDVKIEKQLISLSGQEATWKREQLMGLKPDSAELRRIELAVLNIADQVSFQDKSSIPPTKSKINKYLIFALILVFSAATAYFFLPGKEDKHEDRKEVLTPTPKDSSTFTSPTLPSDSTTEINTDTTSATETIAPKTTKPAQNSGTAETSKVKQAPKNWFPILDQVLVYNDNSKLEKGIKPYDTIRSSDELSIRLKNGSDYFVSVFINDTQGEVSRLSLLDYEGEARASIHHTNGKPLILPGFDQSWAVDESEGVELFILMYAKQELERTEVSELLRQLNKVSPRGVVRTKKKRITIEDLILPAQKVLDQFKNNKAGFEFELIPLIHQ